MSKEIGSDKMLHIMERMKNRRMELNISYQDLAEKTGLSKSTLQRYETGYIKNMPIDKMEDIAAALEVKPSYLMGWEDTTLIKKQAVPFLSIGEKNLLDKYQAIDAVGKHTVETVLEMEYNRCQKPHLVPFAAHALEGGSEEDIRHDVTIMEDDNF